MLNGLRRPPFDRRPRLALNFVGDTSMAYAGLSFRVRETRQWFADLLLSVATHDGPLHKDPVGCRVHSDCGYGIRGMPRFGLETGYRISAARSVSLFVDRMATTW